VTAGARDETTWPAWSCPTHRTPLVDDGRVLECAAGHVFERVNGIPRFVAASSYADHFGLQWNRYRVTQLDSHTGVPITRDRTRRCLGEALWQSLNDKHLLEVGCGAGRFTEILLAQGARVTSVDISGAVEANQRNFPQNDRHRIAQADATALPFLPAQFDVVFCLGVVQHTPSPEETLTALYEQLRPGGVLVFDHYTHTVSTYTKITAPVLRQILKRVSPPRGLACTEGLVAAFLPLHRRVRGSLVGQALLSRVSPIRTYYHVYPELSEDLQVEWARLDTHDALTSWYRHKRTCRQIAALFARLGGVEIDCHRGGIGLEARVRKPETVTPSAP
jgi:2-polyprenyl-3-methyl-5-hydroxy-6-metoxy-1,4-benzoquinol methylase